MTGYKSKRAAAQDKLAQPAQKPNWAWTCNECGAQEFTAALSEADLDYLACSNCGGDEFHKEALAQPAQEPVGEVTENTDNGFKCEFNQRLTAGTKLYTSTQRPWVGLTDEEICKCAGIDGADTWLFETAYALEAKLKEKNNGA